MALSNFCFDIINFSDEIILFLNDTTNMDFNVSLASFGS